MGLDIVAYEKLTFLREVKDADDDPWPDAVRLYVHPDFRERADELKRAIYVPSGETLSFGAGSYSGYNRWRSNLARMVGTTDRAVWAGRGPSAFRELIDFADNEGTIGPTTSAKLAKDFDDWAERAATFAKTFEDGDGDGFVEAYSRWRKAFHIAARGGGVAFH